MRRARRGRRAVHACALCIGLLLARHACRFILGFILGATGEAAPLTRVRDGGNATYFEAAHECRAQGRRLCDETEARLCCGTGCGHDERRVWVDAPCADTPLFNARAALLMLVYSAAGLGLLLLPCLLWRFGASGAYAALNWLRDRCDAMVARERRVSGGAVR